MPPRRLPSVLVALLLTSAGWSTEVGELVDPARWTITGATTFAAADIREALAGDVPVLALLRPAADRGTLLATIERRVALGYASNGFDACRVRARADGGALTVTIVTEGPRHRCGEVRAIGAVVVPEADLRAALTTGWMGSDGKRVDPLWVAGRPVDHGLESLGRLIHQARRFYTERNRPQAEVTAVLVPAADGITDLLLTVHSEGPAMRIGRITISGLQRFDEAAVRALLPVAAGDPLTGDTPDKVVAALRASARFRTQEVAINQGAEAAIADLAITVHEGLHTPPPGTPLTAEQAAAVRVADWLSTHASHGPEVLLLTITSPQWRARMALAGGRGMLLEASGADPAAAGVTLLLEDAGQWLSTARSDGRLSMDRHAAAPDIRFAGKAEPYADGGEGDISLNLQLTSKLQPSPVATVLIEPFAAVWELEKPGITAVIADGELRVANSHLRLTADATSGRLHRLEAQSGESGISATLEVADGTAFAARTAAFRALPELRTDHPLATGTRLLADELAPLAAALLPRDPDLAVLATRLAPWALPQFDALWTATDAQAMAAADERTFTIPAEPRGDSTTVLVVQCATSTGDLLRRAYPADSWPVVLPRSLILLLQGEPQAGLAMIRDVAWLDGTGPLGCLAAAETLALVHHGGAPLIAERGLTLLDGAPLDADLRLLLAPFAARAGTMLDALPRDPPWLAELTPATREQVAAALATAHGAGDGAERLTAVIRQLWKDRLRAWVAARLGAIAHPAPP